MRTKDREKLVFMTDIALITGWTTDTIKHYASTARRARREGTATPRHMPEEVDKVRRTVTKGDGKPLVVWSPRWRKGDIIDWLKERGADEHAG